MRTYRRLAPPQRLRASDCASRWAILRHLARCQANWGAADFRVSHDPSVKVPSSRNIGVASKRCAHDHIRSSGRRSRERFRCVDGKRGSSCPQRKTQVTTLVARDLASPYRRHRSSLSGHSSAPCSTRGDKLTSRTPREGSAAYPITTTPMSRSTSAGSGSGSTLGRCGAPLGNLNRKAAGEVAIFTLWLCGRHLECINIAKPSVTTLSARFLVSPD
jgi:hypothetical protein